MKHLTIIVVAALTVALTFACGGSTNVRGVQQRQTSWGNLEWFELEIDPLVLRFSVLPGAAVMYSKDIRDKEHGVTMLVARDDPEAANVINALDALIKEHRLMESASNEPLKTFQSETVKTPSVHIRIGYGTDGQGKTKRWQSYYPGDNLPPNVKAFIEACRNLGDGLVRKGGSAASEEELVRKAAGAKVLKLKINAEGDIYLDDKQASPEQLTAELQRLKEAGGLVFYYQEPPGEGSRAKAEATADAVTRQIKELELRMITSKKGF